MTFPNDQSESSVKVDLDGFQREVLKASEARPVVVDFWADWCAPCHALAPHLRQVVADLHGRIRLAKIEVDEGENMKLAGHYKLRGFPTVILFHRGAELARFSGARFRHEILDWLRIHLPDDLAGLAVSRVVSVEHRSSDARSRPAFKLVASVGAFGTPAFAEVLRRELLALPGGFLPIEGEQGGLIDPASIGLTLLSNHADAERIEVAVGVFFTEIVGGCSCGDEPLAVNGYVELSLRIERVDGAAVILLRGD